MATLYIYEHDDAAVSISAYPDDAPEWENNHVLLTDDHSCRFAPAHRLPASALRGILENIMRDAQITLGA